MKTNRRLYFWLSTYFGLVIIMYYVLPFIQMTFIFPFVSFMKNLWS